MQKSIVIISFLSCLHVHAENYWQQLARTIGWDTEHISLQHHCIHFIKDSHCKSPFLSDLEKMHILGDKNSLLQTINNTNNNEKRTQTAIGELMLAYTLAQQSLSQEKLDLLEQLKSNKNLLNTLQNEIKKFKSDLLETQLYACSPEETVDPTAFHNYFKEGNYTTSARQYTFKKYFNVGGHLIAFALTSSAATGFSKFFKNFKKTGTINFREPFFKTIDDFFSFMGIGICTLKSDIQKNGYCAALLANAIGISLISMAFYNAYQNYILSPAGRMENIIAQRLSALQKMYIFLASDNLTSNKNQQLHKKNLDEINTILQSSRINRMGKMANYYRNVVSNPDKKKELEKHICELGTIDALCAVAQFYHDYQKSQKHPVNSIKISESADNEFSITNGWSGSTQQDKVLNSLSLSQKTPHIIIAGKSGSGKTIAQTMTTWNFILAKTYGLCLAEKLVMGHDLKEYKLINYKNINDAFEKKSTGQSQKDAIMKIIETIHLNNKHILIIDEILSGVDESSALSFLEKSYFWHYLNKCKPYVLLTSHFKKIHEQLYNINDRVDKFTPYYMEITKNNDDKKPYTLTHKLIQGTPPCWLYDSNQEDAVEYGKWDANQYINQRYNITK